MRTSCGPAWVGYSGRFGLVMFAGWRPVKVNEPEREGSEAMSGRKLRVGMVGGGGPANFFGGPHRRAILMDNSAELTAGALRSKPEESLESARALFFTR